MKIKEFIAIVRRGFNRLAFWFLIVFLLGASSGMFASYKINSWLIQRAVQMGGMIVEGKVYDVRIRL